MTEHQGGCQSTHSSLKACSDAHYVPTRVIVLGWCLKHLGVAKTAGMVWSKIGRLCGLRPGREARKSRASAARCEGALRLQPGELVEVKSESEILQTLDEHGRHRGLLWMPNMARFCEKQYRVRKRIETMMLEATGELRKVRDTVLLEDVTCEDLYGCDRSCYHYWREAWLRRVPSDADAPSFDGCDHASAPGSR